MSGSSYWESFLPASNLTENTTITELMSSFTFSSQSTSELFQATKTKFEAQSSKQKQFSKQARTPKKKRSAGKRGDKNFPTKRGYVVGQGGTQDTDSDEEIDCMLQELREKKETAKKKPDRPKTARRDMQSISSSLSVSCVPPCPTTYPLLVGKFLFPLFPADLFFLGVRACLENCFCFED